MKRTTRMGKKHREAISAGQRARYERLKDPSKQRAYLEAQRAAIDAQLAKFPKEGR